MPYFVVPGGRNLGGAAVDCLPAGGWDATAVAGDAAHGARGRTDELTPTPASRPPTPW